MPDTSDGLPESQGAAQSKLVSVHLNADLVPRLESLVPALTPVGTKPSLSVALRAAILSGLCILEAARAAGTIPWLKEFYAPSKSQLRVKTKFESVRLDTTVVTRLDELIPDLASIGVNPTRSVVLRAAIHLGLIALEPPHPTEPPPCPDSAVAPESTGSNLDTISEHPSDETRLKCPDKPVG
jgi:hypothetical protein